MAQGLSYETFAAVIGVCRETIYGWEKLQPEFLNAKKRAFEQCALFWEKLGIDNIQTGKGAPAVWIYNMKCRFPKQWLDSKVAQDAGVTTNVTVNMGYNPATAPEPEEE